jgi:hypothetical protein
MNALLGRTLYFDFITNTAMGVVSDADGLPTVEVF